MCWGAYALYATSGAFEVSRDHGIYIYSIYIYPVGYMGVFNVSVALISSAQ